ncbi:MAG: hypothetical protein EBR01_11895 [Proteobacteria bacterium]|nr:hypothetical protein [Pseudomonadota bacterium]NBY20554.1 hypothetical protein [bacterium]
MTLHSLKILTGLYLIIGLPLAATASPSKLVCAHFVTENIPFCTVTLKTDENGTLESLASVEHAGSVHSTVIKSLAPKPGEKFRLYLDANLEGQEIEMIIDETPNSDGTLPSVMINHEAPFAKEMYGSCIEKSALN